MGFKIKSIQLLENIKEDSNVHRFSICLSAGSVAWCRTHAVTLHNQGKHNPDKCRTCKFSMAFYLCQLKESPCLKQAFMFNS